MTTSISKSVVSSVLYLVLVTPLANARELDHEREQRIREDMRVGTPHAVIPMQERHPGIDELMARARVRSIIKGNPHFFSSAGEDFDERKMEQYLGRRMTVMELYSFPVWHERSVEALNRKRESAFRFNEN